MTDRNLSLRRRLMILTAVALLPGVALLVANEITQRRAQQEEIRANALRIGELAKMEIQQIIEGSETALRSIARAPVALASDEAACNAYASGFAGSGQRFVAVAVIDRAGAFRCGSARARDTLGGWNWAMEALSDGRFNRRRFTRPGADGPPYLSLAVPMHDDAGRAIGAVVAGLDLNWLNDIIRQRHFPPNDALTITDAEGVMIGRHPFPERFIGTRIPDPFQHLVRAAQPGTELVRSQDGTVRVIGYYPPPTNSAGLYVSAGISVDDAMRDVDRATINNLLIILGGIALALGAAAITARTLIRDPVERILATVAAWRIGDSSARTGMRAEQGELGLVGAAIDEFMADLARGRAERQRAEEQRQVLTNELEHRVKNTLAIIQAIASQTFRGQGAEKALATFSDRLSAMAGAYATLNARSWSEAEIEAAIRSSLGAYPLERFEIAGPVLRLRSKAALAISMAIHELATNAAKYGALSTPEGRISIRWDENPERWRVVWQESGGPPVRKPTRTGFGTRMIERMLAAELGGQVTLEFRESGLVCTIEASRESLIEADSPVQAVHTLAPVQ